MMATYFDGGSEIQGAAGGGDHNHNLQTLYLMNPNFISSAYSESQTPPNNSMIFLNQAHTNTLPHAPPPPHHQQFIGIPLAGSPSSSSSQLQQHHHQIPAALHAISVSRPAHPNLWSPGPAQQAPISAAVSASGPDMADQIGFRRPAAAQGLSLSLSPGMQQNNQNQMSHHHHHHQVTVASTNGVIPGSKYLKAAQELLEEVVNVGSSSISNGTNHFINNDKVGSGDNNNNNNNNNGDNRTEESSGAHQDKAKAAVPAARDQSGVGEALSHGGSSGGSGGENSQNNNNNNNNNTKKAVELSTAQRQELQMKKAKLLNMLEEVEQRYRQYNSQMQVVVSSFEQAAGSGSAKLYTSLALKTISKQFRCLKDAIMSQIKATGKSLGEEDSNNSNVKLEGGSGSRLRFVDHQLRQQRALQQLGMMQHNAWRPQRGLPERAVSVLRAWLFEHFLHPYPKDSDKHMLAKQTGLTRSQVSNWFINARVRLWKPMVEEMYLEEIKTQEQNSGNSEEDTTANTASATTANKSGNNYSWKNEPSTANKEQDRRGNTILQGAGQEEETDHTTNDMISNISSVMPTTSSQGFSLIGSASDMESLMERSPKKQRSGSDMQNSPSSILSMDMEMKPVEQRQSYMISMANNNNDHNPGGGGGSGGGGFNPYIVGDMGGGRYNNPDQMTTAHPPYSGNNNNNGVSLTLGLPNLSLGNMNHQQNFLQNQSLQLGRESDFCGISMAQPNNNVVYDSIDIQNRKRFAAQLLHDHFVASQ